VTDYVKSLISSNQTQATFVIARIVRYDVNQYSNSYYAQGVYDSDGRVVEIASKENSNPAARPALVAWPRGSVASVATNPTNITAVVSNSTLTLFWPADHLGWILQAQTNHAGLGTNWVDAAGSSSSTIYKTVPEGSAAIRLHNDNSKQNIEESHTTTKSWFPFLHGEHDLHEESFRLGNTGYVLSLLSISAEEDDQE